ncbi:ABC transporter substrate-binding protein [Azospirillum canadense]|uniref:ABC transporter substrate-binding protein n=1 Tax=Azospirillum canadense TaxID=403962 RepID=UPI002227FA06|nr:ABC transporter substrate-binding protein [Azospirillum canadense]MCW2241710.1 branched-chain amino acid transport system substrate-binding protein [Azospirillum canadense]
MTKRAPTMAVAAGCLLLACAGGTARAAGDSVIIGLLDDLSGPTADLSGKGKVVAAQMAIDDFGGSVLGKPVKLLASDHQNKPEIASTQAREWYDRDGVDMITGMSNSAVALAVRAIARERGKVDVIAGGTADSLVGADCSPTGILWTATARAIAGTTAAVVSQTEKSWFMLTVDYSGGKSLEAAAVEVLKSKGATVAGIARHPFNTADFSSFLLQAQSSGAKVLALSNTGNDTLTALKQANEFGIRESGMSIVGLYFDTTQIRALEDAAVKGLIYTSSFFWNRDAQATAWAKRFMDQRGALPSQSQAATYSSVLHYLKAVKAAGTTDSAKVIAEMRRIPVEDPVTGKGWIREDGRVMYDMYVMKAKPREAMTGPLDVVELVKTVPADEAFGPVSTECHLKS